MIERVQKIASYLTSKEVTENSTFEELGFDSLDNIEFIMDIETEFCVNINDNTANSFRCIKDVVRYLESVVDG